MNIKSKILIFFLLSFFFFCSFDNVEYKEGILKESSNNTDKQCVNMKFDSTVDETEGVFEVSLSLNDVDIERENLFIDGYKDIFIKDSYHLHTSISWGYSLHIHLLNPFIESKTISPDNFTVNLILQTPCSLSCVNNTYYAGYINGINYGSGVVDIKEDILGNTVISFDITFVNSNLTFTDTINLTGTLTETPKCFEEAQEYNC
ncbi:MAG: hypothetical protein OEZ22_05300 [Spirochaetia bacterium]|nr:hypothetical protein [Spirochaetia bacterium]